MFPLSYNNRDIFTHKSYSKKSVIFIEMLRFPQKKKNSSVNKGISNTLLTHTCQHIFLYWLKFIWFPSRSAWIL